MVGSVVEVMIEGKVADENVLTWAAPTWTPPTWTD